MNIAKLSLKGLAVFLSDHLRKNGIENVLTGGACVCIYTRNRYRSFDLDFVNIDEAGAAHVRDVLNKVGFTKEGRIYVHPRVKYSVDILSPPLSIGEEKVRRVHMITSGKRILKLLSPTDSVKDRLAAYYFWDDRQSLEQAVMICRHNKVNLADVKKWSEREKETAKFKIFLSRIRKLPKT